MAAITPEHLGYRGGKLRSASAKGSGSCTIPLSAAPSTVLITFGRAALLEDSTFPGRSSIGLMRSNSPPVHKPRLPAGRPEHAGNSTMLKTKFSFAGCLRQELERRYRRELKMERDRNIERQQWSGVRVCVCVRCTHREKNRVESQMGRYRSQTQI